MAASTALPPSRRTSRPTAEARVSGEQTAWREKRGTAQAAPPSTRMTAPVVKLDAWLARETAAPTISDGSPPRWGASGALALPPEASRAQALLVSVEKRTG